MTSVGVDGPSATMNRNAMITAGKGPIAKRWNVHSWPTIYILDNEGVIRYRDPSGEALEKAVNELLAKIPK